MVKTLKQLRKEKKVKRRDICRKLDIDEMNLYHYENFVSVPNVIDALLLANYFNVKIKDIQWEKKKNGSKS